MEEIILKLVKAKFNLRLLGKLYPKMEKSVLYKLVYKDLHECINSMEETKK